MLATVPESREVDFSHLKLESTDFEPVARAPKRQSTFVWFALLLSALLHLLLLLLDFRENQSRPNNVTTQTLHIDLVRAPPEKRDIAPDVVNKEMVEPQVHQQEVTSPVATSVIAPAEKPREAEPITRLVIEPLSSQELAEIVDSHNARSDSRSTAAIAENVFDPRLRARLSEEANKPTLARVENSGPKTYTDPAGATIVVLGSGNCLMSPLNTKIGSPKNWYMTPCVGKSESETMMERVDMDVNGKLRFE